MRRLLALALSTLLTALSVAPAYADPAAGNGALGAYFTGTVTVGGLVCAGSGTNQITTTGCSATSAVTSVSGTAPVVVSPTTGSTVVSCPTCVTGLTAGSNITVGSGTTPSVALVNSPSVSGSLTSGTFTAVGTYLNVGGQTAASTTTGDGNFARSASTGKIFLGGTTHEGALDYGISNANAFTLGADIGANTDLYLNSNAVGTLHASGAILNGNGVAGIIENGTATTKPHTEIGRKTATVASICNSLTTCSITGNTITFTTSFVSPPICLFTSSSSGYTYGVQNDDATTTASATFYINAIGAIPATTSLAVNYSCTGN